MTEAAPTTTRGRARRAPQALVRQLPSARACNRYRPVEVLSAGQIETLRRTGLKLLREIGIEGMQDPARAILKSAGAEVDEANQRVRFDPALIEDNIAKVPASFT